jgi:thioredoxin-like negative regulator of GroEL
MEAVESLIAREDALLLYFSNEQCGVCKVLKPKVRELVESRFPRMKMHYVDIQEHPAVAGQHRVFTIPTLLIFFQGKEQARLSRNIALFQVEDAIARPYTLLFEN